MPDEVLRFLLAQGVLGVVVVMLYFMYRAKDQELKRVNEERVKEQEQFRGELKNILIDLQRTLQELKNAVDRLRPA